MEKISIPTITEGVRQVPKEESIDSLVHQLAEELEIDGFDAYTGLSDDEIANKIGFEYLERKAEVKSISPCRRLLYLFVQQALKDRASDIYFELSEKEFRVRFVADGVPYEMVPPPRQLYQWFAKYLEAEFGILKIEDIVQKKRWKRISSETKVTNLREFNDGDFASVTSGTINFNLMKISSTYGQQYHLKIFNFDSFHSLEDLFSIRLDKSGEVEHDEEKAEKVKNMLFKKEKGLVLVAGAPNSGKTTMLYHLLKLSNRPNRIAVAIGRTCAPEDVQQFLIGPSNPDYSKTLKAIRKLKPDLVSIDDISDKETAEEAVHYASGGSLVLASVTSNDAISGINYLLSLGVDSKLLAESLQGVIGRALVRRICGECKEAYEPDEATRGLINYPGSTAYYGKGCDKCDSKGYYDRIPICQIVGPEDYAMNIIKTSLKERKPLEQIIPPLRQFGKLKILKGLTTIEEVWRI